MDLGRAKAMATRFRDAIERCPLASLPVCMRQFPHGSCGDASYLLGTFLSDQGIGSFNYVLGMRGADADLHSHAWIQAEGIIVDITADQFPEIAEPVIVSARSPWHDTFRKEERSRADYRIFDQRTVTSYDRAYGAILDRIP